MQKALYLGESNACVFPTVYITLTGQVGQGRARTQGWSTCSLRTATYYGDQNAGR